MSHLLFILCTWLFLLSRPEDKVVSVVLYNPPTRSLTGPSSSYALMKTVARPPRWSHSPLLRPLLSSGLLLVPVLCHLCSSLLVSLALFGLPGLVIWSTLFQRPQNCGPTEPLGGPRESQWGPKKPREDQRSPGMPGRL